MTTDILMLFILLTEPQAFLFMANSPLSRFVQVTADVAQLLGDQKVDAILCVAGGWAGGKCSSKGQSSTSVCRNINHQPLLSSAVIHA